MVMTVVTVKVPIPKEFDVGKNVRVEHYVPSKGEGGKILLRVKDLDEEKIEEIMRDPNVLKMDVAGPIASIVLNRCAICEIAKGSFLLEAKKEGEKYMIWRLLVVDESFNTETLKKLGAEIVSIKKFSEVAELTETEEEILRLAYEMGYFETPKRTRIRDIATRVSKSPSTVNEVIQRAEKKVITHWISS
ncbi:MAG: helix-turn-helix domain-containing protein [Candidatus Thermoplasmatota archaeon]|nr:helix-turn-helix domain-containing protein [Candidatus Thermoplasmatota archaeon]